MDQGSPHPGGYSSIPGSNFPSAGEPYGAHRTRTSHWFCFHPYCSPLLNSNTCSFSPAWFPFPPCLFSPCLFQSLSPCLPACIFENERAIQTEPRECQAKFLKQAFSSGRRPKHIPSLIGPLADTQPAPLLL